MEVKVCAKGTNATLVGYLHIGLLLALLPVLLSDCERELPTASQRILGRWEVVQMEGMNVPNSFFWFTMDAIEFREDGEVWALMEAPPGTGSGVRLNKTAAYSLVGEDQMQIVGACRHQDPCTGVYSVTLKGDDLTIFDAEGRLELRRAGPPSLDLPPTVVGPSPSATPLPQ
jgi:hypothetical protein